MPFHFFFSQQKLIFTRGSLLDKLLFISYFLLFIFFAIYTYTQVDLGLVITRIPWLYAVEKQFQYIGYYNRPLSTYLFVAFLLLFSLFYLMVFFFSEKKQINSSTIWGIIGIGAIILTFSYNAFSYDLFNYIFDAKILVYYQQNPYLHKALDFPHDPMLGFMHWTQRTYPYGPIWLMLTVPVYFIGTNIFMITFYLFKFIATVAYVGTIYFLYQTAKQFSLENPVGKVAQFALNPLVLFETLSSAHNDIVMLFFSTWAIYLLFSKKYWWAFSLLIISIGVKFATIMLLPLFIYIYIKQKRQVKFPIQIFMIMMGFMLASLLVVTLRTTYQPWYLLYILVFIPLVGKIARGLLVIMSILSLCIYIMFLYIGNWNGLWYQYEMMAAYDVIILMIIVAMLFSGYYVLNKKHAAYLLK